MSAFERTLKNEHFWCNSVCKRYQMWAFFNICCHFWVSITITCKPEMWRHQLFNASWRAKYWFLGISVYIENVHFSMFFRTHSFFLVFDEVEISLTRHLEPVQKPETGSETRKVSGRFMIPGVHIARIRWYIFYHKRCQQARLIALSTGMWRHPLFSTSLASLFMLNKKYL